MIAGDYDVVEILDVIERALFGGTVDESWALRLSIPVNAWADSRTGNYKKGSPIDVVSMFLHLSY
ncbi:hypothetical protein PRBRB14_08020 [Hallella multisaccharivorax DSM 17128]|nr:hypothetical protein PRBRB14_08020 [Hallella multisaccharivorax DSM 17128]